VAFWSPASCPRSCFQFRTRLFLADHRCFAPVIAATPSVHFPFFSRESPFRFWCAFFHLSYGLPRFPTSFADHRLGDPTFHSQTFLCPEALLNRRFFGVSPSTSPRAPYSQTPPSFHPSFSAVSHHFIHSENPAPLFFQSVLFRSKPKTRSPCAFCAFPPWDRQSDFTAAFTLFPLVKAFVLRCPMPPSSLYGPPFLASLSSLFRTEGNGTVFSSSDRPGCIA